MPCDRWLVSERRLLRQCQLLQWSKEKWQCFAVEGFQVKSVNSNCDKISLPRSTRRIRSSIKYRHLGKSSSGIDVQVLDVPLQEYEMTVPPMGVVSLPSVANFALKKTTHDIEKKYVPEVSNVLRKSFYVVDLLKSAPTASAAIDLFHGAIEMLSKRGFSKVKVMSNSKEVVDTFPSTCRHFPKHVKSQINQIPRYRERIPTNRTSLWVKWC